VQETYITLEEAARFEGIRYNTLIQRMKRSPAQYKTRTEVREGGGKELVLLSTASLSQKGRRAYRAHIRAMAEPEEGEAAPPWYVGADLNGYIEEHRKQYHKAVELAREVQGFLNYAGEDRTAYAEALAARLEISLGTLYRHGQSVMEANAWALRLEQADGHARDYFRTLALCRKPRERATFPSLTPEQRALIENIWFDPGFAANLHTTEALYTALLAQSAERGWESIPSLKTVQRYVKHLMSQPGVESAHYLAANGVREWKNAKMLKGRRDTSKLQVMEIVVGDEHTFDCWVQWTAPNGKVKAVRPVLVAWQEQRSRSIIGDVVCVKANGQTLKESLVKMLYTAGVPHALLIDNGKDYTSEDMTGQSRKERAIDFSFDPETEGFYQSIGIEDVRRALPYQPWVKSIERFFGTVCDQFSKWFASYTGTLTGSKTYAKRRKDVQGMLERGELLTLEEFFERWTWWKENVYHAKRHSGLAKLREKWTTPASLFENGDRYEKAVPPREYAAMLLMKSERAKVYSTGIQKHKRLYTDEALGLHEGQWVNVKWDIDNPTKLYVYALDGSKICEAHEAELLGMGRAADDDQISAHAAKQQRQYRTVREKLAELCTPYEERETLQGTRPSAAVGGLDLSIKADHPEKVVALPASRTFRAEAEDQRKKKQQKDNKFLNEKAGDALARLRAMGE
jgi:hypothetical protein